MLCGETALAASLVALAACSNPLGPEDSDYGERVPIERLRSIERLDKERYARPAEETPPPRSKPEGPELPTRAMTLEEIRAATLTNNLDLDVALVDPLLAAQSLRAEEAKFEAVFVPRLRYAETDQPTFRDDDLNAADSLVGSAGVSVPLRSGGRANIDFNQSFTQTEQPEQANLLFASNYQSGLDFSISQPLLRNAGRRVNTASIRIAAYDEQISRAGTKLEVIRQVAAADRAYWLLYAVRRELEVRQQEYELAQEQLARAERRVRAGDAAEVEVLRAQSGVASQLESIITAENAVKQAQRNLKRIINVDGLDIDTETEVIPTSEPDLARYVFDGPALAEAAVAPGGTGRMEMLALELRLLQDLTNIEVARNQTLPLITLDYTYDIGGLGNTLQDSNGMLWSNRFESWSVGLAGEIPIGNEAAKARLNSAILSRLQRLSTKDAQRQSIRQEVLQAVDSVEASWQRILAARQATAAAARTFEAERRQNEVGARTSTDVLDAASRLADAQSSEIRAVTNYQISLVDLAFATGTLLGAAKIDWETATSVPAAATGLQRDEGARIP